MNVLCVDSRLGPGWEKQWSTLGIDLEIVESTELRAALNDVAGPVLLVVHKSALEQAELNLANEFVLSADQPRFVLVVDAEGERSRTTASGRIHYSGLPFPSGANLSHLGPRLRKLVGDLVGLPAAPDREPLESTWRTFEGSARAQLEGISILAEMAPPGEKLISLESPHAKAVSDFLNQLNFRQIGEAWKGGRWETEVPLVHEFCESLKEGVDEPARLDALQAVRRQLEMELDITDADRNESTLDTHGGPSGEQPPSSGAALGQVLIVGDSPDLIALAWYLWRNGFEVERVPSIGLFRSDPHSVLTGVVRSVVVTIPGRGESTSSELLKFVHLLRTTLSWAGRLLFIGDTEDGIEAGFLDPDRPIRLDAIPGHAVLRRPATGVGVVAKLMETSAIEHGWWLKALGQGPIARVFAGVARMRRGELLDGGEIQRLAVDLVSSEWGPYLRDPHADRLPFAVRVQDLRVRVKGGKEMDADDLRDVLELLAI